MADNLTALDAALATIILAAKEIAGVKYPRSILTAPDGSDLTPLTDAELRATALPVSGPVTDAQMRATALPVSGPLTDGQLRATALPVSGTLALDAPTLAALETIQANTGGLTDAELRASAVPVSAASLPLPSGAATEATVAGLLTDAELRATPIEVEDALPPFVRIGFAEVGAGLVGAAAEKLSLLATGSGMGVNQAAGNLAITTGTTANAETIIRSVSTFTGSLMARVKVILSQRIANQTFRFELADLIGEALAYTINSATSVTVTFGSGLNPFTSANVGQSVRLSRLSSVGIPGRYAIASTSGDSVTFTVASWPASGSGTLTLYGWNSIWSEYSGTTATNVSFDAARRGWASGNTTATINTTASPGHVGQLGFDVFTAGYSDALVASNTGYQWTTRASRVENLPDPDVPMYLFIIIQNGSTSPASTTTLTCGFIQVEDQGRHKVRIASADPSGSHALPVYQMGGIATATQPVSGTVTVTSTRITPNAADGHSTHSHYISAASTNDTLVLTGARAIGLITATNTNAAARFLKIYNKATAPSSGDTPIMTILLPPGSTTVVGGNSPIRAPLGLGFRLTTGIDVADTGAVSASEHSVSFAYT